MKPEFWGSIDEMPFQVWRKVHETGNVMLLLIKGKSNIFECLMKWFDVKDEFLKRFGVPEEQMLLLEAKRDACIKMAEFLQTGDRFTEFEAKMMLDDLKQMEIKEGTISMGQQKAQMQKALKMHIDERTWTVADYYEQKKSLENG